MKDALKGLHFFTRFAYSFSAVGYRHRRRRWQEPAGDFKGQRWLVTGASGGIGRAIVMGAAERKADIVAVARSAKKLEQLANEAGKNVITKRADLSMTAEIHGLLDDLAADAAAGPVDVLVNNVGVLLNDHQLSEEGRERSFATNLLNHYVLTHGLIEREMLAEDAVIINMSSGGMYNVPLQLDRLNELSAGDYDGVLAYAYQKRAQVELNEWWRRHYADRDWNFYVMHPGWVDTEGVQTSLPGFRRLFQHVLRDAAAGADTALWLAAARPPQEDDGSIWFDREEQSAHLDASTRRTDDNVEALVDYLAGMTTV